jgi:SAM-dependent methyltransferase
MSAQPTVVDRVVTRVGGIAPIRCPVCGRMSSAVRFSDNLRESGLCRHCGATNRNRQLASVAVQAAGDVTGQAFRSLADLAERADLAVYNTESRGALHDQLVVMPGYRCSEYFGPAHAPGELVRGVAHEDLTDLSFADAEVDLMLSSDVFEHIPDPYRAHAEVHRVLRPGGHHVFTVPFHPSGHLDQVRARLRSDGTTEHLAPPIYHADPTNDDSILVFTIFGLEMLVRLADLGFATRLYRLWRPWSGILGPDAFVFDAERIT